MRAFRVAYDGRPYYGFQRQPDVPTVEDAIFDALDALNVFDSDTDHRPTGYAAAGRTDAGVSALAQTIGLESPDWLTPRALNAELPGSIRAWAAADTPADFHATHHARRRTYTYQLYAPAETIDDGRLEYALTVLSGTHDLHNLTPDDHNTERTLSLEAEREDDYLVLTVSAGGFVRELVRRLVSLIDAVATGAVDHTRIDRVLSPEPLPGHKGIAPAPPEPLVLADVRYDSTIAFERDEMAVESAHRVFETRRLEAQADARVARTIRDGVAGSYQRRR